MHGDFERVESYRQLCVQKLYGKDKLFNYIALFDANAAIGNCNGVDTCLKPLIQGIMTPLSIDENLVNSCMQNDAKPLYDAQVSEASNLGVSGSPTLIVNGVQADFYPRSSSNGLTTICSAFTKAPSVCDSAKLSTANPSPGFGSSTASGSSSSASCG